MCQLMINIGLAPRQVVRDVSFGAGISKTFKKEIENQTISSFGNLHARSGDDKSASPSRQIRRITKQ